VVALDRALFTGPFVLIAEDNTAHLVTNNISKATTLLHEDPEARSIVGTLRAPFIAIDIDPSDSGSTEEAGCALADDLVAWAEKLGLPWLRRASGRPGHIHIIVKAPCGLDDDLRTVTRRASAHHGAAATVRHSLRLTSAPHRLRHISPILGGTLIPVDAPPDEHAKSRRSPSSQGTSPRRRPHKTAGSRSEREYGDALALARTGMDACSAWNWANRPRSKARQIGRQAWRRWFWAPATTVAAAEQHLSEHVAWQRFIDASPRQAKRLGRRLWLRQRWLPALAEATLDRPRRRRLPQHPQQTALHFPVSAEHGRIPLLDAIRCALRDAVDRLGVPALGIRARSLRAALDTLAEAIVQTHGSISVRTWAERAHLDPKTIRRARDISAQLGLIRRGHRYHGGSVDCDAWRLSESIEKDAQSYLGATSSTPYTPTRGRANPRTLRARNAVERSAWRKHVAERRWTVHPRRSLSARSAPPNTTSGARNSRPTERVGRLSAASLKRLGDILSRVNDCVLHHGSLLHQVDGLRRDRATLPCRHPSSECPDARVDHASFTSDSGLIAVHLALMR
jgi:hypothetical protein